MNPDRLPEFRVRASVESVARWRIGRDGKLSPPPREGDPVPLAYFVFLRIQPLLGLSIHEHFGRDPDRGLYGGVCYEASRLPRVGEDFVASAVVTSFRELDSLRGRLTFRTLTTDYRDTEGSVLREAVRMIDLPSGPPSKPPQGPTRPPTGQLVSSIPAITRTQIAWLTVETGDINALHLDAYYAEKRHYPHVVVPGTLTVALLERELTRVLGRPLGRIDLRLTAASFPGEDYLLYASPEGDGLTFELYHGNALRAEGSAT